MLGSRALKGTIWIAACQFFVTACADDFQVPGGGELSVAILDIDPNDGGTTTSVSSNTSGAQSGDDHCRGFPDGTPCEGTRVCHDQICIDSVCGDGIKGPNEQCDDGNRIAGDDCSPFCLHEGCGDGIKKPSEACDDGNKFDNDGCSKACEIEFCGDAIAQKSEECDDGNNKINDGCTPDCVLESCGDGIVQPSEGCDDGNRSSGDGCSSLCRIESRCGNAVQEPGEDCDDGNTWDGDSCPASCLFPIECGNGVVQAGEQCDDGNRVSDDGCSSSCTFDRSRGQCRPAESSDRLPARDSVINGSVGPSTKLNYSEFYEDFAATCVKSCHSPTAQLGGFSVTVTTMASAFTPEIAASAVRLIKSNDATGFNIMPPPGEGSKPFDTLPPTSGIRRLVSQLEAWLAQGKPTSEFDWSDPNSVDGSVAYPTTEALSAAYTNIGTCIPDRDAYNYEAEKIGGIPPAMDAFFAKATQLPRLLSETDLNTLDSAELARRGVLSYAPGYTLWADDAKKMRYIKVPFGERIKFDPATQLFDFPENTRFYKTFLRKVKDLKGNVTYRKMETRVIVARKDLEVEGQPAKVRALYGTYKWNDAETQAVLIDQPLRNGEPFIDEIFQFDVDEAAAKEYRDTHDPSDPSLGRKMTQAGLTRSYLLPGSIRCEQCHEGSVTKNFVAAFSPVQLLRRPIGEGGVIEESVGDELTQLQRFISLGLFEGLTSSNQALRLEDLQGERKPRNEYETRAQGYMLGNCAHCHNPRGFPTIQAPVLADNLDMYPTPQGGGIFQFPLERYSPRNIWAGILDVTPAEKQIPYITPSIYDVAAGPWGADSTVGERNWAPWRSLIYRNVDTPATYPDDLHGTVFPRMPMHTTGIDCRARNIMGDWMVSIPARLKKDLGSDQGITTPQPWEEVHPGDADYAAAASAASKRLGKYHGSDRYDLSRCENGSDVIDPLVKDHIISAPRPGDFAPIPGNAHAGITDLTDPADRWDPRRGDWQKVIATPEHPCVGVRCSDPAVLARHQALMEALDSMTITEGLRSLALTPFPIGLWREKPECSQKLRNQPTVQELKSKPDAPLWLGRPDAPKAGHVYSAPAGGLVFQAVCQHCHGKNADSAGAIAGSLSDLTGGLSRTANFRAGVFGPADDPGRFADSLFASLASPSVKAQDWSARYMAWMALGGTNADIPPAILSAVAASDFLGGQRAGANEVRDANMLEIGRKACLGYYGMFDYSGLVYRFRASRPITDVRGHNEFLTKYLVPGTGDFDLWEKICTQDNPLPIRVLSAVADTGPFDWMVNGAMVGLQPIGGAQALQVKQIVQRARPDGTPTYPAGAPIFNQDGVVEAGLSASNFSPTCIAPPHPDVAAQVDAIIRQHGLFGPADKIPYCPPEVMAIANEGTVAEQTRFSMRGAANAAFMVNVFLREFIASGAQPAVGYDRCEELP
jgi:cysteine-rich repeat protein